MVDAATEKEKIRVLIVDDIPETRENLRKLLYFEKDVEVVGTATSGQEAVDLAVELRPSVVLMDINMPGMDGISATKAIIEKALGVQVIMMSVQGEMSYVRESMRAGAREFLIKPFTSDELNTSIRRVHELRPLTVAGPPGGMPPGEMAPGGGGPAAAGKVIAVFSTKGGAGCSTVATNLACALKAESEIKVALWDTSFQFGDIGVMLNMQASRTIVDILPQIEGLDADVLNGVMQSHASGVRVLLAPPEPQFADSIRTSHLEKILAELRQLYDFVVIDTWSSLYDQMLFILDAADRIVLLVTPEVPAIKNTKLFFDITDRLGYPPDKIMLVLNKWDRRSGIRPEKVQGVLNHRLDGLIPLDDRTVPLSVNQGTPFVISYKTAPISQSVFELSKHLLEALRPQPETAASAEEADGRSARRLGGLFR